MNYQAADYNEIADKYHDLITLYSYRAVRPWLHNDALYAFTSAGKRVKQFIKASYKASDDMFAPKIKTYHREIRYPNNTIASQRKPFADALIEAAEKQGSIVSPEQMRGAVTHILGAGIETTTNTLAFALMLIGMHPEVQAEVHLELDDIFGADSKPASSEDLKRLEVLDRCLKEALRLFPVVTMLSREITKDVHIPSGYVLPAGCAVYMLTYATHRDPRYFSNPLKFNPDRWLPEHVAHSHPYAYLAFSAGTRNCIGYKYAPLLMKSILSKILRDFSVSTDVDMDTVVNNLNLSFTLTMNEEVGFPIQLTSRKY